MKKSINLLMWVPLLGYVIYTVYYLGTWDESYNIRRLFNWAMYQLLCVVVGVIWFFLILN